MKPNLKICSTNFQIWEVTQNSGYQKGKNKHKPSWGPTYVRYCITKFNQLGNLVPGICVCLV